MKLNIGDLFFNFGICLFVGVIIIAIGFGAALPFINRVAAPFSCPGKDLQLSTETYSYRPGDTTTTSTWLCVDKATGAQTDVSFQTVAIAGVIYSVVLFVIWTIRSLFVKPSPASSIPRPAQISGRAVSASSAHKANVSDSALGKLSELKQLYEANLITEQEYQQKKAEILEKL